MSNDNKTLADVQPGGRVRLGDQTRVTISDDLLSRMAYAIPGAVETTDKAKAVAARVVDIYLSAQPSPGGQGGLADAARRVISDVDSGDYGGTISMATYDALVAALAARQPVGEPVAWMTHHDEPMLFPTAAEAAAYCEDDEQPVPLFRSPAQAVDLGQFRAQVAELLRREFDLEVADPDDHRHDDGAGEADRIAGTIAALIESKAVGNG
ncbi:hypothetical protein K7567_12745 [Stenotrophomonas maltophilia]|nr:hypothetical protein K7567_12745 [Stenotrophomonas maltophilia]